MVKITEEEILKHNPKVDPEALKELKKLAERLAELGVVRKRYELGSPYETHNNPVSESESADRRQATVHGIRSTER